MFTTQIGPPNLGDDYLEMLRRYLKGNIENRPTLLKRLESRTGARDLQKIEGEQFETFFKLATPKLIASILNEQDWYVDPIKGIRIYEVERQWKDGAYKMLHRVMHICRKHPPSEKRAPGQDSAAAQNAYVAVVDKLFPEEVAVVTEGGINQEELRADLEMIKEHRRRVYPEGE